ncbi:cupin-like domain-containing protein [Chromobacterium vaccinii]|uniref:JmjC domain-containing protein n=1 Tax=Chromobacterium vaccinii TaxID=1108595 RepID=A0A1D9LGJ2_9NEIS|nr:cupin-like domain-containing protein [Chromobacterium vaccinii]AOZ50386.1 hypothetical protein BKX93_10525 [Chromobacterium vaccinii]QND83314.1 Uncharacterized protein ChrSW_1087 [Chromobacterium vaccinii]QND88545.1 Uncharacterized protein ChrSV_1087 [Chromobacterium vaccinii]
MKFQPIPRIPYLSAKALTAYLAKPASPLILTTVMRDWPAMRRWSFDYFAQTFGDFPVVAHAPQFPTVARWSVRTRLSAYIDYLKAPEQGAIAGEWLKGDAESLRRSGLTLYAGNFNPAHAVHGDPERIFADVPKLPDFIDNWLDLLNPRFRDLSLKVQSHYFVYLSVPGGVTPLHHDFWSTHAFLAQISGRKEAVLFAPADAKLLYQEQSGIVPAMRDDPRFADVIGWQGQLGPGDFLLMPAGWLHYVETLEASITYSADWIDGSNWRAYIAEAEHTLRQKGEWQ